MSKDNCEVKKTLVKPEDLPIYDVITNDAQVKAKPEEPNAAVQAVKTVRRHRPQVVENIVSIRILISYSLFIFKFASLAHIYIDKLFYISDGIQILLRPCSSLRTALSS